MLAELAACNAAYAIISQVVKNGSELSSCAKSVADFTLNKDTIQKKASAKGGNADGSNSDLEEFLALDELKRKEAQLRSDMQLYGRAGMYTDYVAFCAEARRKRAEVAKEARRKQLELQQTLQEAVMWIVSLTVASALLMGFVYFLWSA